MLLFIDAPYTDTERLFLFFNYKHDKQDLKFWTTGSCSTLIGIEYMADNKTGEI